MLYKNDTEPNIYLIDSIKPNDTSLQGTNNHWSSHGTASTYEQVISNEDFFTSGSYKIDTENIWATLPSNQSLRPWDNVPRKAVAQEITGNRIVYANYTQNYDLGNLTPQIDVSLQTRTFGDSGKVGQKSIKSLRNYDIGVVWGDEYGRETPVITPNSGSLNVPKSRADQSNFISAL